jgi:hypothetical protein
VFAMTAVNMAHGPCLKAYRDLFSNSALPAGKCGACEKPGLVGGGFYWFYVTHADPLRR